MIEIPTMPEGQVDREQIFSPGWPRDVDGERTDCDPGSLPRNTLYIQHQLAQIIVDFDVQSINDVNRGDLAWIAPFLEETEQTRDLAYVGYDVVRWPAWQNLQNYDLRQHDCVRDPLEPAGLTVIRNVILHQHNYEVEATLAHAFASSELVFATSFNTGETPQRFSNDRLERALRFTSNRLNLVHAMIDLDKAPFNFVATET
jgi:hypothetical protein